MTKRILHISDLHGNLEPIHKVIASGESFDWIVMTGDMPIHFNKNWSWNDYFERMVDAPAEAKDQRDWLISTLKPLIDKIPHTKSIYINGNHCFCDPSGIFDITLYKGAMTMEIDGIKVGLAVGIKPLQYEWHEELPEPEFEALLNGLDPTIQILITHAPPSGILDLTHYNNERIGYICLYQKTFGLMGVEPQFTNLKMHLFGHVHESFGTKSMDFDANRKIVFSNASCGYNILEFESISI